jgi:predicted enzyme related to lactoylglutathione lyase
MPRINQIVHLEWRSANLKKLQSFYQSCFDWKFKSWGDYVGIDTGSKEGGGGMMEAKDGIPTGLTPYIRVKDLGAAEAKVKAAGGQIMMSQQSVPDQGTFSIFIDPDGHAMGLWQAAPPRPKKAKAKAKAKAKKKAKAKAKPAKSAKAAKKPAKAKAAKPKAKAKKKGK